MSKQREKGRLPMWQKYLKEEIRIDFKACLYFFCMVFFYSMYRIYNGYWDASIIYMAEMIAVNYVMGYVQVYFLENFDEAEKIGRKEALYLIGCTIIYTVASYLCDWFDRSLVITVIYFGFMVLCYFCVFLSYKIKRELDTKSLMEDLRKYKEKN